MKKADKDKIETAKNLYELKAALLSIENRQAKDVQKAVTEQVAKF